MNRKLMFQIAGGLLTLSLLAGCTTSTPILTLTINENKCTFDGPKTIPNGEFTVRLVNNQQNILETGYALITLENDKNLEDLNAWPSADQPPWAVLLVGVHEMTTGTHIYTYDPTLFTQNAAYHGGPYYIVCFCTDPNTGLRVKAGAFGPIEIEK